MQFITVAAVFLMSAFLGFGLRAALASRAFPLLSIFVFGLGLGTAYFLNAQPIIVPWTLFLAAIFAGIVGGFAIAWVSRSGSGFDGPIIARVRASVTRVREDFRISAILIGLLLSYVLTFYFGYLAVRESPPGFWHNFYPAWISGVLLFTVVGLVGGLVALYRPERDVFAARVKILVGGKVGSAVDYIAEELRRIGYVSREVLRNITIEEYDSSLDAFKIRVKTTSTIRNIYDDVGTKATGIASFKPDKYNDPPSPCGQITSFKLNGTNVAGLPFDFDQSGVRKDWSIDIPGAGVGIMEYEHWAWYKRTELHEFSPARFTEVLKGEITCRCQPAGKKLMLTIKAHSQNIERALEYDGVCPLPALRDLPPFKSAYTLEFGISP